MLPADLPADIRERADHGFGNGLGGIERGRVDQVALHTSQLTDEPRDGTSFRGPLRVEGVGVGEQPAVVDRSREQAANERRL